MAIAYDNIIYNSVMDSVERVLLDVRDEIRDKMRSEGVNASGRTSAGMQVQRYETGVRLVLAGDDVAPLATLEVGRGKGGVPRGFTDIIEQWSIDKGLSFSSPRERRRFSYLTARKIASRGTKRHTHPIDVYSEAVQNGLDKLRYDVEIVVTDYVHNFLKNT